MLADLAGWIAPVATIVAAMMTAANLGARLTGWGFVVFTLGSICWICVGLTSAQPNLVLANGALTVVNLTGIWRWLGRQSAYEDGGRSAKVASRKSDAPTLFTATGFAGMPLLSSTGETVGKVVEGLIECRSATMSYIVVATPADGGIGEELRAVPRRVISFCPEQAELAMDRAEFVAIAPLKPGDWPASV